MTLLELKLQVVEANKELPAKDLVKYSWGNVSAIDREKNIVVIKPVGIPYPELTVDNVSVYDLESGKTVEGLPPSVDLDIHLAIYKNFETVNAIVHTHSTYATVLAQLGKGLPAFGTTHSDYFAGEVPCVPMPSDEEIKNNYEWATGMEIVKTFNEKGISPDEIPAAICHYHGTFTWGHDSWDAVHKAVVLEEVSKMAVNMYSIQSDIKPVPDVVLNKHYYRKHGADAYFTTDDYGKGTVTR